MKNPVLSNTRNIYYYFAVWAIIMVAHSVILYIYYHLNIFIALADGVLFNLIFAGLALTFWYPVRYLNIDSKNATTVIINHITTAVIFLIIWIFIGYLLIGLFTEEDKSYFNFFQSSLIWRVVSGLLYYALIILFYYLYIYYSSFKEKLTKEASLRALVKETELSLLKSQINPHFIFNSLNSINSLIYTNPDKAGEMIVKLSSFLRFALEQNSKHLVNFSEELDNSQLYLDIEKTRFGEKLVFKKFINKECNEWKVPNLILQPLLENAVKYGVYESIQPVTIELHCNIKDNFLQIHLKNNYDTEAISKRGKGIGLKNVKERLFLIYGQRDLINISDSGNLFEVNLFIPQNLED